jgi:hypothetical protein
MGSPSGGYDISSQLAALKSRASAADTAAATKLASSSEVSVSKTAAGALESVATSAAQKLQQQLNSKLTQVTKLANSASTIANTAASLGTVGDRLPGLAGSLTKSVGGAAGLAGLSSKLSGGNSTSASAKSATSLINSNLADTMFTALPTDDVLVVDAYGIKDNSVLNSVVGKLTGFAKNSFAGLGGLTGVGGSIASSFIAGNGGFNLNTDVLKDRVLSSLGGRSGVFNALSGTLRESLTSVGLPQNVYDQVEATINGVTQYISSNNVNDVRSTFDLISRITGQSELASYLDVGATATLMATVFRESIDMGVPDAITAMLENSKSSEASYYALQSNIVVAADIADLQTLTAMLEKLGAERIRADCPDVISRVLSNYRFPAGTTVVDYPARYATLDAVLRQIDGHWGYVQRQGEWVTSTAYFEDLSADAKTLLSNAGPFGLIMQLGPTYPSEDLPALIASTYPYALV